MNRLLATSSKLAACFIVLLMAFLAFAITEKKTVTARYWSSSVRDELLHIRVK